MGKGLTDFLTQTAQSGVGGILGIGFGAIGNAMQSAQNAKLLAQQQQYQKELMDYQYGNQLKMWNATNYEAQMAHLKAAGLNPALMYGMGGGGGTTTGGGMPGGGGTGAQNPAGNIIQMATTAAQLGLMRAQKENIEADTRNKEADTQLKPITGESIKSNTVLTNLKQEWQQVQNSVARQTMMDAMKTIEATANKTIEDAKAAKLQNKITEATLDSQIKQIHAEAIGAVLRNALTQAQKNNTNVDTELKQSQTKLTDRALINMVQELMIKWDELSLKSRQQLNNDWNYYDQDTEFPREIRDILENVVDKVIPTPVTMKKR